MGKAEIINVMKLANNNELQYLQGRADYLRNLVRRLEIEYLNMEASLTILSNRIKSIETPNMYQPSIDEMKEKASLDLGEKI